MKIDNCTPVTDFVLAGFGIQDDLQVILFSTFLVCYIITLIANTSIMIITISDRALYKPMYFFLYNLAFLDICYSSVVVPKMITNLISHKKMISFHGCILQIHFFHFLGSTEAILFTFMSYDRYVAIAHPLRYSTIMSYNVCFGFASCSWVMGFFHALIHSVMTSRLPFCGVNTVIHFFCDVKPVLNLASTDVSLNFKLLARVTGTLTLVTLMLIVLSYILIGNCLSKIKTSQGRKRALSTCSGHFSVVTFQYGTALFIYVRPSTIDALDQDRAAAIMFSVITPALNPIIYTLRNKDMKNAVKKLLKRSY
ncbi:olfactory receptor 12D1-like [Bufo gargarizans]|uniref:olfactory receptor 12D1-like n=1 Tax=Bufo gargarizans TaxID=30331 RepID=UPI001CF215BE|nr:olfactory receptor 12D1-like [Bufo gargarizans]